MEPTQITELLNQTGGDILGFLQGLLRRWNLYQIGITLVTFAGAILIGRILSARMRNWMRSLEGRPKWQLRLLLAMEKRLPLLVWALILWAVYLAMHEITWPSRSYLIAIIARVVSAWFAVEFVVQLVRNRSLRRTVRWGLWAYVTLYFFGGLGWAASFLDSIAVEFGDFRLSALSLLKALVVTGLLVTFARITARQTSTRIRRNEDISPSMRELIIKGVQVVLYGAAFFIGLKAVGFDLTGLAVLSGAIGVGLGFGLQKVVSNLVSGVIILLDKSIKPGDVISLGDTFGWINTLGARYASITTRDGREFLIPNEDLITGQVVNWSHTNDFVRLDIFFGTAYDDDPHQVRQIAIDAAKAVNRVLTTKPPVCHIVGFGDSSVDYILRFWISDPTGGLTNVRGDVYLALWDAFKEGGISIPFPQREVRVLEGSQLVTKGVD
ncbi:MAG: mechanosensitive ion channel [Alphaproteobacteria bacterium]|nr:mechanosensitive ion channel [Alphaproteobacteria bacterium]MBU1278157.1 mechanosensitive ion channel [Alphaproteobacteria bacterium]MBU1574016.1 mechanosensitive ion channel [Alphaproteobacteria bacterium]MBU1829833.1 mechanosensitive ion channel [Alphaproteobacteria bacterium]MBU2077240.1 mechanosensitive ion channel [Alphaproteobacteria bacterium]